MKEGVKREGHRGSEVGYLFEIGFEIGEEDEGDLDSPTAAVTARLRGGTGLAGMNIVYGQGEGAPEGAAGEGSRLAHFCWYDEAGQ